MASIWVKEEVSLDYENVITLDVTCLKHEPDNAEIAGLRDPLTPEKEDISDNGMNTVNNPVICSVCKVFECKQSPWTFRRWARFVSSTPSVHRQIYIMHRFLKDFREMSLSHKSVYCRKMLPPPLLVKCSACGKQYMGRNRMLELFEHVQALHHSKAIELTLNCMKRYIPLLDQMRQHLLMDRRFASACFD